MVYDVDKFRQALGIFREIKAKLVGAFIGSGIIQTRTLQNDEGNAPLGPCPVKFQHLWIHRAVRGVFGGKKGHNDSVFQSASTDSARGEKIGKVHFSNLSDVSGGGSLNRDRIKNQEMS